MSPRERPAGLSRPARLTPTGMMFQDQHHTGRGPGFRFARQKIPLPRQSGSTAPACHRLPRVHIRTHGTCTHFRGRAGRPGFRSAGRAVVDGRLVSLRILLRCNRIGGRAGHAGDHCGCPEQRPSRWESMRRKSWPPPRRRRTPRTPWQDCLVAVASCQHEDAGSSILFRSIERRKRFPQRWAP
jgi:hypothetical protein